MPKAKKRSGRQLLADNLRHLRVAKGWSQVQLAEKADMSRRFVEDVETLKANATLDSLDGLAAAFDVDVFELLRPRDSQGR